MSPLLILAIGVAIVLGMILFLKINAFIALITAAIVVSLLAPVETSSQVVQGERLNELSISMTQSLPDASQTESDEIRSQRDAAKGIKSLANVPDKIERVAIAFGVKAGGIAIVIALAAVIGVCMMDSGAADKVVRSFVAVLGEKRASTALMGSGFVLSVPVFFDTVFYLLVPLARSLYKRTHSNYLMYLVAIAAGGAITHTLVPPTPGPLVMAQELDIDIGQMIGIGALVALPAAFVGLFYARWIDGRMDVPFREIGDMPEHPPLADEDLPPLSLSLLPVLIPVLLIAANTVVGTLDKQTKATESEVAVASLEETPNEAVLDPKDTQTQSPKSIWATIKPYTSIIGNANFAMLLATAYSLWLVQHQRGSSLTDLSNTTEAALMSAGTIILITAAGGAFGEMLKAAQIGPEIQSRFASSGGAGMTWLLLGYGIAALLKVAQGSSTAAMIVTSGMVAAMIGAGDAGGVVLEYNRVYLATAIGAGSLMGSWMNDSGFWIFTKMGGLTEVESLKSWTPMLALLSLVSLGMSILLAIAMPMVG